MISTADVKLWLVDAGIGHAVATTYGDGYAITACGIWGNLGVLQGELPRRICRKCRERLKAAEPVREGA